MRGSLGVWAESVSEPVIGKLPILELHINVWRDLPKDRSSIDFGFQITQPDDLNRMFLYIPAALNISDIEDLSEVLKFGETLSAVFNDTVEITSHNQGSFDVKRSNGSAFRIFDLKPNRDFAIEYVPISASQNGSVITFSSEFCERLRQAPGGAAYLRVRVHLSRENGKIFYSYASPADSWLLSRFYRTELNEFRLNERRSFPDTVVKWSENSEFRIVRVLYFLIRDFRYELLVQHVQFKRTRRLEPGIWQKYLAPTGERISGKKASDVGDRMLIYQWREDAPKLESADDRKWIEDFSAFASFKSPKDNIWAYVLAVLALGALGSALQATVYALSGHIKMPFLDNETANASSGTLSALNQSVLCLSMLVALLCLIAALGPIARSVGHLGNWIRSKQG